MTPRPLGSAPTISTEEDSPDLTDHEVEHAVETSSFNQLAQLLSRALALESASVGEGGARYALSRHEVRRRAPHLYLRSHLVCPGAPPKMLLHRIDWIQAES